MENVLIKPLNVVGQSAIFEHFSRALQFATISHADAALNDAEAFTGLHRYFAQAFPALHACLKKEVVGDHSLLYTWEGQQPQLPPVLLLGHMDVMPIEAGTKKDWLYPPFSGCIAEGYLWGRGSLDDKVTVIGILEAVEALAREGFHPLCTVYLAFGDDEECSGLRGAAKIVATLQSRGVKAVYSLDEGLAIVEGVFPLLKQPLAMIGLAEKGFVNLELSVNVDGGHAMMPPPQTAIGILAAAIARLEKHPFPSRVGELTRQFFAQLATGMPWALRLAFSNQWLFGGLIQRQLSQSPSSNAFLRTTMAATMFHAGVKENALPGHAAALLNLRLIPGDSIAGALDYVQKTVADPRVQVKVAGDMHSEASRVAAFKSSGYEAIAQAVHHIFPEVMVVPSLVTAATDSRYYAAICQDSYRFTPEWMHPDDLPRVHGTNERISLENYTRVVAFYKELIRSC